MEKSLKIHEWDHFITLTLGSAALSSQVFEFHGVPLGERDDYPRAGRRSNLQPRPNLPQSVPQPCAADGVPLKGPSFVASMTPGPILGGHKGRFIQAVRVQTLAAFQGR